MSRLVARAENWERAKTALDNVNFAAFDYAAIKQSLLDYLKLYYPEVFNDFIESSELIAIIESFAYVGELLAYRYDVDARENLLAAAQLRSSILRLAKLVSYNASRPIPARGLVKITAVATTQTVFDPNGQNLTNRTIKWNDGTNVNWKSQFIQIMQLILAQRFGTVDPDDRFQIADELFEIYQLDHSNLNAPTLPINALVNGRNVQMELVPVEHSSGVGIIESRPSFESKMNLLYGTDGLGDASSTTGFFLYVKQGKLQRARVKFDGVTPNQIYEIAAANVNDTDVWMNQVDPTTNKTVNNRTLTDRTVQNGKSGNWVQVETANSQNIIFNTNPNRNKFEVQTIENNGVRLNFGDGNFADIPNGTFDIWYRTSVDEDLVIPQSSINNVNVQLPYVDQYGLNQTITLTISLINSLQNASASETDEHIKVAAPALYYTQDRMVNGEDYNNYPLRDPSILKLRTFNRTFVGDSRYVTWHDPSGYYEDLFVFGKDGMLFFEQFEVNTRSEYETDEVVISNAIVPLLGSIETFTILTANGVHPSQIHKVLYQDEYNSIMTAITSPPVDVTVELYWNTATNRWIAIRAGDQSTLPTTVLPNPAFVIRVERTLNRVDITRYGLTLILLSPTTTFLADIPVDSIIDFNTLNSLNDTISILEANVNANRTGLVSQDWNFVVTGTQKYSSGANLGLPNVNALRVIPMIDGFPQSLDPTDPNSTYPALYDIMCPKMVVTKTGSEITVPIPVIDESDFSITDADTNELITDYTVSKDGPLIVGFTIGSSVADGTVLHIQFDEYVYFTVNDSSELVPLTGSDVDNAITYAENVNLEPSKWARRLGRQRLNFNWTHVAPYYNLIDPSPSNINDVYIITKGYFVEYRRWLDGGTSIKPTIPSNFGLRSTYDYLLGAKMISDTAVLHHGKFKLLFGSKADATLRGRFKVVKRDDSTLSDNQIKNTIVSITKQYFDVTNWEFGETFYFSDLAAAIHQELANEINSVVFVPEQSTQRFGDGYQVRCKEDEVFMCDIDNTVIDIVSEYSPKELHQV